MPYVTVRTMKKWRARLDQAAAFTAGDWRLFLEALVLLVGAHAALRLVGLPRLVTWASRVRPRHALLTSAEVERAAWFVAAAGRLTGLRCLPRALALTRLLGRRGVAADLRIGVRHEGSTLLAHAWVEWNGRALNDDERHLQQFARFEGALSGISHA
jgi:hypothetical protein